MEDVVMMVTMEWTLPNGAVEPTEEMEAMVETEEMEVMDQTVVKEEL